MFKRNVCAPMDPRARYPPFGRPLPAPQKLFVRALLRDKAGVARIFREEEEKRASKAEAVAASVELPQAP